MTGYGGRTLHVDLTSGRSEVRPLDERTARAFLGGNGLAARLLWEAAVPGTDAFDPANPVALAVGPITDTLVPGNSRACVATKSPQTGLFFDSTFGGRFPAMLKRTGFDAVVVTGRAEHPVYLAVDEEGATVRDARGVWGKTTRDTVDAIQAADGAETDVLAIGPAGEHRVRFACLAHYWKNREGVAGRGGIGAVLGREAPEGRHRPGEPEDRRRRSRAAQAAGGRDPRAHEEGHREPLDVRHTVPHRAHQRDRRPRRVQPQAGDLRRVGGDRRALAQGALPRPGHDVPQVPGRVRQAVRRSRRRPDLRRRPGKDARVRDPLRLRLDARQRERPQHRPREHPVRPPRARLDLHGRDARLRGGVPREGPPAAGRRRRILRLVGSRGNDPPARADRAPRGIR